MQQKERSEAGIKGDSVREFRGEIQCGGCGRQAIPAYVANRPIAGEIKVNLTGRTISLRWDFMNIAIVLGAGYERNVWGYRGRLSRLLDGNSIFSWGAQRHDGGQSALRRQSQHDQSQNKSTHL
ncbi:MAG: hypothetical protein H0X43_02270 [Nitrosospira sp.]|nr:hypothetical protein [Nitrosospira sp.]